MIIGAAWVKETQKKERFFSCVVDIPFFGKFNFAIFKCKEKKENGPDYQIVWNPQKSGGETKNVNYFKEADPI